ncbi:hypothetical protein ALQ30_05260 [Pseudomonas syringae pv. persicae]|uniref:Uncharacterized protein n=1 Tax=Pseudomonas syringae pv. persicae TaxID=237306 RepID=A0A3M3ZRG1_9PSED|nr:hypothetical protein ALQ30_05260 [Pseudomonas syringae pv. persicae]
MPVKGLRKSKQLRGYLLIEPTDVFSEVPYVQSGLG